MAPFTAVAAFVKESASSVVAETKHLQLTKAEIKSLVPIQVIKGPQFQVNVLVENVPLGEHRTSLFSASEFKELSVIKRPEMDGVQIRLGSKEVNLSLKEDDVLSALGVKNVITYALTPGIDQFIRIRLHELGGADAPIIARLEHSQIELPAPFGVAVPLSNAGAFLTKLEKVSNSLQEQGTPLWFSARRIDYLVGNQYVPGRICDLPLVGGISDIIFKRHLDLGLDGKDWGKLGSDVFMVISIVALPMAPAAGGMAMLGWIAANATFGAVSQGAISYLNDNNEDHAMKEAGKGALLGAVAGVAGVAVAGKILPSIANKFLAATASGATVGASTGATEATIRVIENGEDLAAAAKEVAVATMVGGAGGAAVGASLHGVSKIVAKLETEIPQLSELLLSGKAKEFETFEKKIEPVFPTDRPLHGGDIRNYSRQLDSQMDGFAAHLKMTDAKFSSHVEKLGSQLSEALAANDPILVAKVERQMRRGLAGEFAEAKVKALFQPYFDKITTQKRVNDGATIIDMVLERAKHPIALKGHRFVGKGESIAIEVKAGSENYFKSEIDSGHLMKQLAGHTELGKGLVITTRDVSDALMKTGHAREMLKAAGSAPYRLPPYKSEIDAAIGRLLESSTNKS